MSPARVSHPPLLLVLLAPPAPLLPLVVLLLVHGGSGKHCGPQTVPEQFRRSRAGA